MISISKRRLASLATASAMVATMAVASMPIAAFASEDVPACQATEFRHPTEGTLLTAAQVGGTVSGDLDGTGCDIGVYNPTSVSGATISGALHYGIVVNGGTVDVKNSTIRNIGHTDPAMYGMQRGIGIFSTGASGEISGNTVTNYQKGGIVAKNGGNVTISGNTVIGRGPVNYIAQNGIQISSGTSARLFGNDVSGNAYTPKSYMAAGLLIYKAGGVSGLTKAGGIKADNNFHDNEADVFTNGKGGTADFSPTL